MTDRELMQQALVALKFGLHVGFDESSESQIKKGGKAFDQHSKTIAALRERLAQPEQDLVCVCGAIWEGQELVSTPLPRQWKGLTDEEINNSYLFWVVDQQDVIGFGKSIETKLKRKNT